VRQSCLVVLGRNLSLVPPGQRCARGSFSAETADERSPDPSGLALAAAATLTSSFYDPRPHPARLGGSNGPPLRFRLSANRSAPTSPSFCNLRRSIIYGADHFLLFADDLRQIKNAAIEIANARVAQKIISRPRLRVSHTFGVQSGAMNRPFGQLGLGPVRLRGRSTATRLGRAAVGRLPS
jgi:hypothetical protein